MKKTTYHNGHRWTHDELKTLMNMWSNEATLEEIATALNSTQHAIGKMVVKLRREGVPLKRRRQGHVAGRANALWSQGEIEYLMRRRLERATAEQIAEELGRTYMSINGMIQKLRSEGVSVPMRGMGVRRLWDANSLKSALIDEIEKARIIAPKEFENIATA